MAIDFITRRRLTKSGAFLRGHALIWGGCIINPWTETFPVSRTYDLLAASGVPEWVYGLALTLVGSAGIVPSRGVQMTAMMILATMHGLIALSFGVAAPDAPGPWLQTWFCFWCIVEVFAIDERWRTSR